MKVGNTQCAKCQLRMEHREAMKIEGGHYCFNCLPRELVRRLIEAQENLKTVGDQATLLTIKKLLGDTVSFLEARLKQYGI